MVFCGKPSKGCDICRARKVKCDQGKPACTRCVKGGRVCPGYRDLTDLSFRDESEEVVRKARVRQEAPVQRLSRRTSPAIEKSTAIVQSSGSKANSPIPEDPSLSHPTLSVSVNDQATCYFLYNFVCVDLGLLRGHLDQVPTLIQRPGNGALEATVTSVGMAGLSNTKAAPHVMVAARQTYAKALRLINAALQDPIESRTDQTLSAVLLLGLFEVITCNSETSMESWTNHIDGAAALLRFRGPEQLRTRTGLAIFMQCRAQILISSLQRRLKANVPMAGWGDISNYHRSDVELPAHRLSFIVARISGLRAAVKDNAIIDTSSIVLSFLSIEAALAEWVTLLTPRWAYTTVDTTESDTHYGRQHHVYEDIWIASVWNSYRCVRLLCNEEILVHIGRLSSSLSLSLGVDYSAQARMSRNLLNQLAADICISATFHLGQPKIEDGRFLFECRSLFGFYLLWPLFVAASVAGTPDPLRLWVIRVLDGIGRSMGIQQASALAEMLKLRTVASSLGKGQDDSEGESCDGDPENGAEERAFTSQRRKDYYLFATLTRDRRV